MQRLFKLCRYNEGAALLARALSRSVDQLYVPFFMLLLMVITAATCIYHIEFNIDVARCEQAWRAANVSSRFLRARPAGVQWGCEVCPAQDGTPLHADGEAAITAAAAALPAWLAPPVDAADAFDLCTTCVGYPQDAPECLGVPFAQQFLSIPHSAWFVLATVTTGAPRVGTPTLAVSFSP